MFNRTKQFWKCRKIYFLLKNKKINLLSKLFLLRCRMINRKSNSGIAVSESISEFNAPHGFSGIYISKKSIIGKNCIIFQQVTIGSNDLKESKNYGAPKIGDNVYIGAGAKIIGNVNVGNNVKIGANCVVVSDIPDNSTVVLNSPRIIRERNK